MTPAGGLGILLENGGRFDLSDGGDIGGEDVDDVLCSR